VGANPAPVILVPIGQDNTKNIQKESNMILHTASLFCFLYLSHKAQQEAKLRAEIDAINDFADQVLLVEELTRPRPLSYRMGVK